jgi:hypothetical protein
MATALLFGIPQGYVKTAKSAIERNDGLFTGWSIKYLPSNGNTSGISQRDISKLEQVVQNTESLSVFGFSDVHNRHILSDQIAPYFRFRWFKYELLRFLGSPDPSPFVNGLATALVEELEWSNSVRPADLGSPLLLPVCAFKPERKHSNLWRHACAYGDLQNVFGAAKAIESFRNDHYRKVEARDCTRLKWVDSADRIFSKDGARHGVAPFPRNWKYSFQIEAGFHFDVTKLGGQQFTVEGADGGKNLVKPGGYLNIDPHGMVRH